MTALEFRKKLGVLVNRIAALESEAGYECGGGFENVSFNRSNPDENQLYLEFGNIMEKLIEVKATLNELNTSVEYTSRLYKSATGKYKDDHGLCYSCGYGIEYLYIPDDEDDIPDDEEEKPYWRFSRVEHNGEDYYIVGDRIHKLDEVLTRIRK